MKNKHTPTIHIADVLHFLKSDTLTNNGFSKVESDLIREFEFTYKGDNPSDSYLEIWSNTARTQGYKNLPASKFSIEFLKQMRVNGQPV